MMKRLSVCALMVFVIAAMIACGRGKGKYEIKWGAKEIPASRYALENDDISITYPVATKGKNAELINGQIEEMLTFLIGYPGEDAGLAVDSLLAERNSDTMILHIPYTVITEGEGMNFGNVASTQLAVYQYTGGAHGLGTSVYLNFDIRTGGQLDLADIITDTASLRGINIQVFRENRDADWESGLFMPLDRLPLPEYAGVSSEGIHVHYNPYEIAPYVFGPTDYIIPIERIKPLLNKELFPDNE